MDCLNDFVELTLELEAELGKPYSNLFASFGNTGEDEINL